MSALFLSGFLAMGASAKKPGSSSDLCGQVITEDLKLDHDLVCAGNGLIVGADGITIDLNGHSITGPGQGPPTTGIRMVGRANVSIEGPGVVMKFRIGILIGNSHGVEVEKLTVMENGLAPFLDDGIRIQTSTDVEIEKNDIFRNGDDGIHVHLSSDVDLEKNRIVGNRNGVRLTAMGNAVVKNKFTANTCGVKGATMGNELIKNHFAGNGADFCA